MRPTASARSSVAPGSRARCRRGVSAHEHSARHWLPHTAAGAKIRSNLWGGDACPVMTVAGRGTRGRAPCRWRNWYGGELRFSEGPVVGFCTQLRLVTLRVWPFSTNSR
jgi:hypothetical protein